LRIIQFGKHFRWTSPFFERFRSTYLDDAAYQDLQKMKRNLIVEQTEGNAALAAERDGKITLKHHVVKVNPAPTVTAKELLGLREKLRLSRGVFARYLRTNERTLENWEQGRAKPNAQAALLIRLVELYPDTVERLASI
jgi:putative transcriptional regulator